MADLTKTSTEGPGGGLPYQTYTNAGAGVAASVLGNNKAGIEGQGIAGRTVVVELNNGGNVSQAELDLFIQHVTAGAIGDDPTDAFTIVGIEGTADDASGSMFAILQGTGTVDTGANEYGAGVTVSVVADFAGLKA